MEPGGTPGASEYSWGAGLVNPSIITGQPDYQDGNTPFPQIEDKADAWSMAVADRRTDSTDPTSGRDFTSLGNPDRYGGQPSLVQEAPRKESPTPIPAPKTGVTRAK